MMKQKLKGLLLAAALVCALAGCNTANNSSQTTAGTEGTAESTVEVRTAENENGKEAQSQTQAETEGRRLTLTLEGEEGTREISAVLNDTPAADEFVSLLPLTVEMHEHLDRQKEVYLPFSLSEENLTNQVHEYEIGDIVYWHPGPTMGIFHDHDGRSISAGVEVLARLEEGGAEAIASYEDIVTVTFALDETAKADGREASSVSGRQLEITLSGAEGEHVIYAALLDTPAAAEFAGHLPLEFYMTDYANREKHAHMDFSIEDSLLENITVDYEIGDIIYYPPGPTFAMYYDHDGRTISAGMEVIARMDQEGIDALGSYENDVEVTVTLTE